MTSSRTSRGSPEVQCRPAESDTSEGQLQAWPRESKTYPTRSRCSYSFQYNKRINHISKGSSSAFHCGLTIHGECGVLTVVQGLRRRSLLYLKASACCFVLSLVFSLFLVEEISASFAKYRRIGFSSGSTMNLGMMLERRSMSPAWKTPRSGMVDGMLRGTRIQIRSRNSWGVSGWKSAILSIIILLFRMS